MKNINVEWYIHNEQLLFKETILECELPRMGEHVIYMNYRFKIHLITRNFDNQIVSITLKKI